MKTLDPNQFYSPRGFALYSLLQEILRGTEDSGTQYAFDEFAIGNEVPMTIELLKSSSPDELLNLIEVRTDASAMKKLPSWMQNALITHAQRWFRECRFTVSKKAYATDESVEKYMAPLIADAMRGIRRNQDVDPAYSDLLELDLQKVFPGGMR